MWLRLFIFSIMLQSMLMAADGDLDTSFGFWLNGKVIIGVGGNDDGAYSVAIQNDGKIVVAGYSDNGSNDDFALMRFNTDGTVDRTFGDNGSVITEVGGNDDEARSIAIQNDGKIVVAGYSGSYGNYDFALVRYNPDGSLDGTFSGGKVITDLYGHSDQAYSVAIQNNGKIVVAGSSNYDFALVRYNPDGSLDGNFDWDGKVITDVGGSGDKAYSVAIQNDGKIVAAGYSWYGSNYDFALARYNTDGTLDTTFSGDGKVITNVDGYDDQARSIAIQNNGKIVVAGYSGSYGNEDFALVRYNSNGIPDTSFSSDGKVITDMGGNWDIAYSVAIQNDGKIVAAGFSDNFALARYSTDGTLDTTFSGDGKVITDLGGWDEAYGVAIQSDGKIVAAGKSSLGGNFDFALVRYQGTPLTLAPIYYLLQ